MSSNITTGCYFSSHASTIDYYPFGQEMPGRVNYASSYRMGFNGQWKDSEFTGTDGCHYEFKFREYDSRIGRFWSVDPLFKDYPWNSTYAFAENRVIDGIDLEGKEWVSTRKPSEGIDPKTQEFNQANDNVSVDPGSIEKIQPATISLSGFLPNKNSVFSPGFIPKITENLSFCGTSVSSISSFSKGLGVNIIKGAGSLKLYTNLDFHGSNSIKLAKGFSFKTVSSINRISTAIDVVNVATNSVFTATQYNNNQSFSQNWNSNEAFQEGVSNTAQSIISSTISFINVYYGMTYNFFITVRNDPEMEKIIQESKTKKEINQGVWQINTEPQFIGPGNQY